MKTNNTKIILAAIAISFLAQLAITKITISTLPVVAVTVSYVAVALLFVLAAVDAKGRRGLKGYSMR
jgi:hypothetical protein